MNRDFDDKLGTLLLVYLDLLHALDILLKEHSVPQTLVSEIQQASASLWRALLGSTDSCVVGRDQQPSVHSLRGLKIPE